VRKISQGTACSRVFSIRKVPGVLTKKTPGMQGNRGGGTHVFRVGALGRILDCSRVPGVSFRPTQLRCDVITMVPRMPPTLQRQQHDETDANEKDSPSTTPICSNNCGCNSLGNSTRLEYNA